MKTLEQWFAEYSQSHQNKINQNIHFVCVPIIFFTIMAMFVAIPLPTNFIEPNMPFVKNAGMLMVIFLFFFYLRLSWKVALQMLVMSLLALTASFYLAKIVPLFTTALIIFILAWIGQFYGHKKEGKRPSFFTDIQFLLIGPPWVIRKIFG